MGGLRCEALCSAGAELGSEVLGGPRGKPRCWLKTSTKCCAALIRSAWRRAASLWGLGRSLAAPGREGASLGDISPVGAKALPLTWWRCPTSWAAAAWRARPGRGHAGYPHRGDTDALSRARTATGWGTPYLKIVVLMVFAPQDAGDEPPPCLWHEAVRAALCEHRRRGARGGVRGDLGRWCCNAWAGGESLISS